MEQKKPISHIVAGLIIAGFVIALQLIMTITMGDTNQTSSGWIQYLIIIIGLAIFIYMFGKSRDNYVTFGELFSYGFKATMMVTLVFVLYLFILSLAMPEMKDKALEATRVEMEKQNMKDSDIDTSMGFMEKYFWLVAIAGSILGFIVVGAIGSLIGAALTPKRPKNPFDQASF
jgi:Ca2+/Na+ antiporter